MNERHRKKRLDALRYILSVPRSLWYNLRLLPIRQAVRMPLLISNRTVMDNLGGRVVMDCGDLRIGMMKIGFTTYQGGDYHCDRTHVNLRGTLVVLGRCQLGAGSGIEVAEGSTLTIGPDFNLGPRSLIICHKDITFGAFNRISWCCTVMDTDQHRIVDADGRHMNPDRAIVFGDNVWLGCHVIVAKGTHLPDDTTVAAGATVAGRHDEPMTVLAGNPATVVRRGVKREWIK